MISLDGTTHSIESAAEVARILLSEGAAQKAVDFCSAVLAQEPEAAFFYNLRGVGLQELEEFDLALYNYDIAIELHPEFAEAYSNRGSVLQVLTQYASALHDFDQAILLKPGFAMAHNNRGNTLVELGRLEEAIGNYTVAIELDPEYAKAYYNRGIVYAAMARYSDALKDYHDAIALAPKYPEAHNNIGIAYKGLNQPDKALESYDRAIECRPSFAEAFNNRGVVWHERFCYDAALVSFDTAIALNPDYAEAHNNRGNTLLELKRFDDALESYDTAIALKPEYPDAYHNRGVVLVDKGAMREAETMFRKALSLNPRFAKPLYSLINIKKYRAEDDEDLVKIAQLLARNDVSEDDKSYLLFAQGKIHDDCSRYDEAFESYRSANEICGAGVSYDRAVVESETDRIIEAFNAETLSRKPSVSDESPVFIVGMPRSGTTLLASMLSCHPSIESAGELPTISELWTCISQTGGALTPYREAIRRIDREAAADLTARYVSRLKRDVATAPSYIIDKHPLNFKHLGLISLLFPKARILHCTRNSFDTALSNYFQRFSANYDYSFDLATIGHYYSEYVRLMEYWKAALPMRIQDVSYEDTVSTTATVVSAILDFLNLPWDDRCVTPHTNPAPIETASNWQVRQPIHCGSMERWRRYEKHIGPLAASIKNTLRPSPHP